MRSVYQFTVTLFLFFAISISLNAQVLDGDVYVPGKFIIQFNSKSNIEKFTQKLVEQRSSINLETIGNSSYITIERPDLSMEEVISIVENTEGVVAFQHDAYLEERSNVPNDFLFNTKQWNMKIIKAPEAWDITTGGTTPLGHEIVVGVLDGGYYIEHPDLAPNLFTNKAEIPGNGIDDDNNGFIDDVHGANLIDKNGTHSSATHGTGVMGIIGARGNNSIGLAGVNWNVKILPVSRAVATVSALVQGYEYLKEFRVKFNQTKGAEGAFIVAVNLSAGISNKFPIDHPIWCNMYDSLGSVGILSTGATANAETDVEVKGDLPSTCPSEFLMMVTNTNSNDVKHQSSGYGNISIDLGAPGEGTTSTPSPDGYELFGGTSSATPHVAGAIALMYAAPNTGLEKTYMDYPVESARTVRNAILNNVDILPSLIGKTVSGGRLNLFRMLNNYVASDLQIKTKLFSIFPNPTSDQISIDLDDSISQFYNLEIINVQGLTVFSKKNMTNSQRLTLQLPEISNGLYFLKITSKGYNGIGKFVVSR